MPKRSVQKNKWTRNYARAHNRAVRHKKDFEWRPKKSNPYTRQYEESPNWGFRLKLLVLFSSIGLIIWLLLFHPFFQISNISITGTTRQINSTELTEVIQGIMSASKLGFLPSSSYFVIQTKDIEDILLQRFPIKTIDVTVHFPNTLELEIEERISTIMYGDGEQYSFVGLDGQIIEPIRQVWESEWIEEKEITTTTLADGTVRQEERIISRTYRPAIRDLQDNHGNLPVLYDSRSEKEGGALVDPVIVENLLSWFNQLTTNTDVPIGYIQLLDAFGNAEIITQEGWRLRINLLQNTEAQYNNFIQTIDQTTRPTFQYIDVRYGNKVHWL